MFLLRSDIFFWDLAILLAQAFSLCGGVVCVIWIRRHAKKPLRNILVGMLGFISFLGCGLVTYGSFIEPQLITVTEKTIHHPLGASLKIAVISDMHVGPYKGKQFIERVVRRTNALLPDIVLLPGDFIFTHNADLSDLEPLQDLRTTVGVYAVLGNHDVGQYATISGKRYTGVDRGDRIAATLESLGITVLRNASETITLSDGRVHIAGVDDIWTGHDDTTAALGEVDPSAYSILLSHNPSIIDDSQSLQANLIVSGHTHGGQIRLPFIGPITTLPTSLGSQYDQGIFDIDDDTTLAITRGVGESSARSRLFAIPEILLLKLN